MDEGNDEHRIQESPNAPAQPIAEPVASADGTDASEGFVFGALVGLLLGIPAGLAICWLLDVHEYRWIAIMAGAALGVPLGALIGRIERRVRGELVRPDIATFIGVAFGIPIGLLIFLGIGAVRGAFSAVAGIAMVFMAPAAGLLLGASLDRAYESVHNGQFAATLKSCLISVISYVGVCLLVVWMMQAPDAEEIARETKHLLLTEWRKDPALETAKIKRVFLTHVGDREYSGFVDATLHGIPERMDVQVFVTARTIKARCRPRDHD